MVVNSIIEELLNEISITALFSISMMNRNLLTHLIHILSEDGRILDLIVLFSTD